MTFQWNDTYRIGVEELDSDHQDVMSKLNFHLLDGRCLLVNIARCLTSPESHSSLPANQLF
jgi:hypothetical protein